MERNRKRGKKRRGEKTEERRGAGSVFPQNVCRGLPHLVAHFMDLVGYGNTISACISEQQRNSQQADGPLAGKRRYPEKRALQGPTPDYF
jgi:hypothetical protein